MKKVIIILVLFFWINNIFSQRAYDDIIDIQEYTISLDFSDMNNSLFVKGYTNVELKPVEENTSIIKLDLLKLNIDSITCESTDLTYSYNDTVITINMSESFGPTNILNIKVYYNGSPVKERSGFGGFHYSGGYAFNMGCAINDIPHNFGKTWFPCNDSFTDRASYRFIITTKAEHTAVCNGQLINTSTNEENQTITYEWKLDETIPTYLAGIAVGPYFHYTSSYNGLLGNIPVDIYVYPGDSAKAARSFVNLNSAMSIFESKFGPYKWNRIGYVAVPFSGGAMEHSTNIAIAKSSINGGLSYESLFYHELGHHWFGNLSTCSSAEDMWMNEGWATYLETIFEEFMYSRERGSDYQRASHLKVLKDYNVVDGGFLALSPMNEDLTYSSTVYKKGGSVVHALRGYLGDDIFFDAIKEFLARNSYSAVTSYDLRDFLSEYTGINMADFFNDWVFTGGFVHFSIDSTKIINNGGNYEVTVYMKQKLRGRTEFANSNRVEVSFLDNNFNANTQLMEFDGETGSQTFIIPFEPVLIFCDYNEVLSDATTDYTKIITTAEAHSYPDTYFKANVVSLNNERQAILRVTHNFVAPDDLKNEVPGLFIANNRYWTIEGNFPGSFKTKGDFSYNESRSSNLDYGFITNSLDSLVLLYRPDRASDWSIETATNSKLLRKFTVDSLKAGEYALGIYDWGKYTNNYGYEISNIIHIYPNPNSGKFTVLLEENFNGIVNIYNISGQKVYSKKLKNHDKYLEISSPELESGQYILEIQDQKNNKLKTAKLIIQKI